MVINMEIFYNKLVRDGIPSKIERNGEKPIYHECSREEYWHYLLKKDQEELQEVENAETLEEIREELADKLEVLKSMAEFHGLHLQDIILEANKKREKKGGFSKRLFLEKVITK